METKRLYREAQRMQCWAGDTLPEFRVFPNMADLTGCSMSIVVEPLSCPGAAVLTKACADYSEDERRGFAVQLTSADTAALCGSYRMHFVLTDASDLTYRKLVCELSVLPVPEV